MTDLELIGGVQPSSTIVLAAEEPVDDEIGEFQVAEYIIFLLALDTYMRYAEETTGQEDVEDAMIRRGLRLLRNADNSIEMIRTFIDGHLPGQTHKTMLNRAVSINITTPAGASRRALQFRTFLSRGGPATMKGVFENTRFVRQVRDAISASMLDDADRALDVFAAIPMRNARFRDWIDDAAKQAGSGDGAAPTAVDAASSTADGTSAILVHSINQMAASGAEEAQEAQLQRAAVLDQVERDSTEVARKSLEVNNQPDEPPTRSEVVGVATAAAVAALNDPSRLQNVPQPLRTLDDEQRSAALTEGRVVVGAGAGAGKSTTLVARIEYLVREKSVNPSRIVAVSFNRKAANELKEKVASKLGKGSGTQVDTMHALFAKLIVGTRDTPGFGTPEEQAMLRPPRLIAPTRKGERGVPPASLSTAIRGMWEACSPEQLTARYGYPLEWIEKPPKAKKANLVLNKWRGNDVGLAEARASVKTIDEAQAFVWYDMYLGIKGDSPGWRPPCPSKPYDNFMNRYRKGGERLGDLDDMLKVMRDILKRDPAKKRQVQGMFDHILVDECQDLNQVQHQIFEMMSEHVAPDGSNGRSIFMIGDDKQCVAASTPVAVDQLKRKPAGELKEGDQVLSYRNGILVKQIVRHAKPSQWTWGYKVVTSSGRKLTMSPNHKIWAQSPTLEEGQVAVYLMYRRDLGFRVGITNKCHDEEYLNSFGGRAFMEKAERMWVLEVCADRETALLAETSYSLKYGVPTMVFGGENRGINQDRVNAIFSEFGRNGARVLEAKNLNFDLPHWMSQSYTKHGRDRRTIQMIAHGSKGSQVSLEWSGDDLDKSLQGVAFVTTAEGRRRLRKWFHNYREALAFAERIADLTKASLSRRLSTDEGALRLLTASGIFPGMQLAVLDGESLALEAVISVEKVDDTFVDIDVDDASNFFGDGILSHNSIYQFRGAKPELFKSLYDKEGWTTKLIRTNYRCQPEIVEAANRLIAHDEDRIQMEARPDPKKDRGRASIQVTTPEDNTEAAIQTIGRYRKDMDEGADPENFAVLARTNAELNDFETACIINEIPYIRRGGRGFLEAPESRAVLGYMDLASGSDYEKMKKSLVAVLTKPDRSLFLGQEDIEKAVDEALDDVARRERVDIKAVRPDVLLESRYVKLLADKLKQPYRLKIIGGASDREKGEWMYGKRVEELAANLAGLSRDVRDLRDYIEGDTPHSTDELLNYVLDNMKSEVTGWDRDSRRTVTTTTSLREQITNDVAIYSDDDDDEAEDDKEVAPAEVGEEGRMPAQKTDEEQERKGLGAVRFLYELAKPNQNDQTSGTDPSLAKGFVQKVARYSKLAESLRIDPVKWEKAQQAVEEGMRREKPPAITLSTVHSVKGAQWKNVTVLMPRGLFPMERKPKPGEPPPDPAEEAARMKAERNLAYVALTRAAVNLEVTCPMKNGVSPFVREAGLKVGENVPKEGADALETVKQADVLEPVPQPHEDTWHPEYG